MKKQIVVIGLGRFGTSLATTLACLGHDVLALDRSEREVQNVASQVTHAVQIDATNEALLKEGADRVVYPECEMGVRVAQGVTLFDVSDYMSLSPGYGVSKLEAPHYFVGRKLNELGFVKKGKWEVAVFLIMRDDEIIVSPCQNETVKADDVLIIAGSHDNLEKLLAEAKKNEEEAEENSEKK